LSPLLIDLTEDLSLSPTSSAYPTTSTFNITPPPYTQPTSASCTSTTKAGCLTITGNADAAATVITTSTGQHEVLIANWSHVLINGFTFRMPMELMDQGTYVSN
jgi:hypothetical protein